MKYANPIIPGFYPDPSCCRVGSDFYLVNSTFEYFPGVPIFHSKNLINWELIGHCLTRKTQLPLEGIKSSGGIYAPTIRYHDGVFYMVTTLTGRIGNFIVHTRDPRGEWSEPAAVDAGGIDPSLFWDDDGTCWFCSNPDHAITAFAIDPLTGKRLSERYVLSRGTGAKCLEGPHIYKKDGYYYLLVAEGGTEMGHRVSLFRSDKLTGEYIPCPQNPILSHMEKSVNPYQATGHAELFDDENGNWWMVFLGIRLLPHLKQHLLGRETFLAPVRWENGWPVVGCGGYIEPDMDAPLPAAETVTSPCHDVSYDFASAAPDPRFIYIRNPQKENYVQDTDRHCLRLSGTDIPLHRRGGSPTFLGIRQPSFSFRLTACLNTRTSDAAKCGITVFQTAGYHHSVFLENDAGKKYVTFTRCAGWITDTPARIPFDGDPLRLFICANDTEYTFGFVTENGSEIVLGTTLCATLGAESIVPRSFTGVLLGMFAEQGEAEFTAFDLKADEGCVTPLK